MHVPFRLRVVSPGSENVVRLSLRTKDRAQALRWGLEALAVFEELLRMDPAEALKHLTQRLVEEQVLKPEDMTGADLIRRRALGSIGAKIIRNARDDNQPTEQINAIYRELVFINKATFEGEQLHGQKLPEDKAQEVKALMTLAIDDLVVREWNLPATA